MGVKLTNLFSEFLYEAMCAMRMFFLFINKDLKKKIKLYQKKEDSIEIFLPL